MGMRGDRSARSERWRILRFAHRHDDRRQLGIGRDAREQFVEAAKRRIELRNALVQQRLHHPFLFLVPYRRSAAQYSRSCGLQRISRQTKPMNADRWRDVVRFRLGCAPTAPFAPALSRQPARANP
jgi:hypothetical protein